MANKYKIIKPAGEIPSGELLETIDAIKFLLTCEEGYTLTFETPNTKATKYVKDKIDKHKE